MPITNRAERGQRQRTSGWLARWRRNQKTSACGRGKTPETTKNGPLDYLGRRPWKR